MISERTTSDLVRDFDAALRTIGVTRIASHSEQLKEKTAEVSAIHNELLRRGFPISSWIDELSRLTGWRMKQLLDECLAYPELLPQVRDADGLRVYFKCSCRVREYPDESDIPLCDPCVLEALRTLKSRRGTRRFDLFSTDESSLWCRHANAATLMLAEDSFRDEPGLCETCLLECLRQRGANVASDGK